MKKKNANDSVFSKVCLLISRDTRRKIQPVFLIELISYFYCFRDLQMEDRTIFLVVSASEKKYLFIKWNDKIPEFFVGTLMTQMNKI